MEIGIDSFVVATLDRATGRAIDPATHLRDLIEEIVLADEVGLDVFGIGEHHRAEFTAPQRGSLGLQLLVLGLTSVVLGLVSDGLYALAAGKLGSWLKRSKTFRRAERYVSGSIYCGLGLGGLFYRVPKGA